MAQTVFKELGASAVSTVALPSATFCYSCLGSGESILRASDWHFVFAASTCYPLRRTIQAACFHAAQVQLVDFEARWGEFQSYIDGIVYSLIDSIHVSSVIPLQRVYLGLKCSTATVHSSKFGHLKMHLDLLAIRLAPRTTTGKRRAEFAPCFLCIEV